MGLSGQEMSKKGFFAGIDSAPGIDDYQPVEIETRHHSTGRDYATIATMVKSAMDKEMEARDTPIKKPEVQEKKLTTQEHP